jgi:hypothetical protein
MIPRYIDSCLFTRLEGQRVELMVGGLGAWRLMAYFAIRMYFYSWCDDTRDLASQMLNATITSMQKSNCLVPLVRSSVARRIRLGCISDTYAPPVKKSSSIHARLHSSTTPPPQTRLKQTDEVVNMAAFGGQTPTIIVLKEGKRFPSVARLDFALDLHQSRSHTKITNYSLCRHGRFPGQGPNSLQHNRMSRCSIDYKIHLGTLRW